MPIILNEWVWQIVKKRKVVGGHFDAAGLECEECHDWKQRTTQSHGDNGPSISFVPVSVDQNIDDNQ